MATFPLIYSLSKTKKGGEIFLKFKELLNTSSNFQLDLSLMAMTHQKWLR
jgi:hypothetical protein